MPPRPLAHILLQEKPCLVLLSVVDNRRLIISDVMQHASTTFSHATNLITELEARGLLTTSTEGRVKHVRATPLGKKVAKAIRAVNKAGDSEAAVAEVKKLSRRARQLLDDWDSTGQGDEDTARLHNRFRRLEVALESLECQLLAADVKGKLPGQKELNETMKALRTKPGSGPHKSKK